MPKHRRRETNVVLAVQQYEQLVVALRVHQPGERSGLCLTCGIDWPCAEVWLPLGHGQLSGELPPMQTSPERDQQTYMRSGEQ